MSITIDKKIAFLPPEKQELFIVELNDLFNNHWYFRKLGINYSNPNMADIEKVKESVFENCESYLFNSKN